MIYRKKYQVYFLASSFFFLLACSTASLSKNGRQVEVISREEAKACVEVEKIEGSGSSNFMDFSGTTTVTQRALSDALNQAGKAGATHLVFGNLRATHSESHTSVRVWGIAYQCSKPSIRPAAEVIALSDSQDKVASPDQLEKCGRVGVYRGVADQPLFKTLSREQLEDEAMKELVREARGAHATHLVKGFTYRISNGYKADSIKMVIQFGKAYDCAAKK